MDLKTIERVVGQIERTLFRNSNYYSIGMLRSHFKGMGLQFREHQIYVPGDDVRFIDWKMLARTTHPYIKTFEEERNVEIVVVLDLSPSMLLGYEGKSKLEVAVELTGLLYLLAHKTKDTVKVILFGEEIKTLPNKVGKEGISLLINTLEKMGVLNDKGHVNYSFRLSQKTSENSRLATIKKYLARRKEVVIFSDFIDLIPFVQLKRVIRHSNVHCFQLTSPVDLMNSIPYSLFLENSENQGEKSLIKVKAEGEFNQLKKMLGKKFKSLSVEERYLEEFVKEML